MEAGYVITIPKTSEQSENGKTFTVFTIVITGGGKGKSVSHTAERRYHNFKNFDMDWRKIYGATIGNQHQLPSQQGFLSSKQSLAETRRRTLQKYLQDLVQIGCLQPMVLAFCGVDVGGRQTDEVLDPTQFDDLKPRGNNLQASEKANAEKLAFMEKNRDLLHQLMPGFSQPLSFETTELKRDVLNPHNKNPTAAQRALVAVLSGHLCFKRSADPSTMPFHKRFCVFVGCQIGYYANENDPVPLGTVVLSKFSVIRREPEDKSAKFIFSVTPQVGKMFYLFTAPDSETYEKWISTLERQIAGGFDSNQQKGMFSGKVKVIKSYVPSEDEKTCVEVKKGEMVVVTNRDDPAWFYGTSAAGEGYFPSDCLQREFKSGQSTSDLRADSFDLMEQLKIMTQGANFLKFPFKSKGKPKKMSVFYRPNADSNSTKGCLFYCPAGEREMSGKRCLLLNQLAEVIMGKGTSTYTGKLEYSEHLCFSLNYLAPETNTPRTLDLMADTRQMRDDWVRGLREIVASPNGEFRAVTIAMPTEKPEAKPASKPLKALPPSTKRPPAKEEDAPPLPPRPDRNAHVSAASHAAIAAQRRLTVHMAQESGGNYDQAKSKLDKLALPRFGNRTAEEDEARDEKIVKATRAPPASIKPPPKKLESKSSLSIDTETPAANDEPASEPTPAPTPTPGSPANKSAKGPPPKARFGAGASASEESGSADPPSSPALGPKSPGRAAPPSSVRRGPDATPRGPPVPSSPDEGPPPVGPSPTSPKSPAVGRGPPPAAAGRSPPPRGLGIPARGEKGYTGADSEKCNKCSKGKSAPGLKFCPCGGMFG